MALLLDGLDVFGDEDSNAKIAGLLAEFARLRPRSKIQEFSMVQFSETHQMIPANFLVRCLRYARNVRYC